MNEFLNQMNIYVGSGVVAIVTAIIYFTKLYVNQSNMQDDIKQLYTKTDNVTNSLNNIKEDIHQLNNKTDNVTNSLNNMHVEFIRFTTAFSERYNFFDQQTDMRNKLNQISQDVERLKSKKAG